MVIYDKNNNVILDIPVDDTSYRYRAIRQGDKVYLYFSLTEHVEIPVYSYINYQGQRYTLWKPENLTKNGERNLEYTVEFGGWWELLNRTKYKFLSGKPHKLKFPLTGTPRLFLQLLVDNLNLHDSGWALGTCIEGSEKAMAFDHENGMEVINRFADEWNTEFEFISKTINFGKVERFKDDPLPLSYGKGNGFKTGGGRQTQGEKAPVTILYVQGGERNIDVSAYGSSTLLLPKNQILEYQGRKYKTDQDGMFITRADRDLVDYSEDSYDASNIYPSRVGTVSEVITVDPEKNIYNIKDSSIPAALDYSQCRIAGEKATIIFQSGILISKEFDLEQTDDALTGYIHAERRFKIVPQDIDGTTMPNETSKPAVGDKYAIFKISLPDAYVCDNISQSGASWDMFREAVRYMFENEDENFTFTGELDGIWAKKKWSEIAAKVEPGCYIQFSDNQFQPEGILIRITSVKDYINKPHAPEIELSNTPVAGFVSSELGKLEGNEVKDEERYNSSLFYTKRSWRDVKETQKMMFDPDGSFKQEYTAALLAEFGHLVIGMKSQQMDLIGVKFIPNADNNANSFKSTAGKLVHFTIKETPTEWTIPASSHNLSSSLYYYVYAKCNRTTSTGSIHVTNQQIKFDSDSTYYYFWIGTLNTPEDNVRSWLPLFGYTEIAGQSITTGIIKDKLAKLVIDLVNAHITAKDGATISGKILFGEGSSGLDNVAEWPAAKQDITNAKNSASQANQSVSNLGDYVDGAFADGIIEESEAKAIEKYINTVKTDKATVEATYNKLYVNTYLTGTAKSGLLNAKVTLFGAIDNLQSAINSAIADGRTTVAEKNNVDSKFSLFNSAMSSFNTAVETANKAIQDKLKEYADNASGVPDSFKNEMAQRLGYANYAALEAAADASNTIIKNGKINTTLIEATAIITSRLIADAIKANSLDVNGNFLVDKEGKATMVEGAIGPWKVSSKGLTARFTDWNNSPKMAMMNNDSYSTASKTFAMGLSLSMLAKNARVSFTSNTAGTVPGNAYRDYTGYSRVHNLFSDCENVSDKKTTMVIESMGAAKGNTALALIGALQVTGGITSLENISRDYFLCGGGPKYRRILFSKNNHTVYLPSTDDILGYFGKLPEITGEGTIQGGNPYHGIDNSWFTFEIFYAPWASSLLTVRGSSSGNGDYSSISGTPLYSGRDQYSYGQFTLNPGEFAIVSLINRYWFVLHKGKGW